MKKTILALSFVFVLALMIGGVYAYQSGNMMNRNQVDKDAAQAALESGDYSAWAELHNNSNGRMASLISESNFNVLQQMHEAREAGNYDLVQELKAQLGFKNGQGQGQGMGKQNGMVKARNGNCPMLS